MEHALKRIGRNAFGVEILFPFLPRVATQGVRGRRMSLPQIPKGFRPKAQGCDAGETLGKRMKMISTPKALRLPPHRTYAPIIIRCLYPSGIFHKRMTTLFARDSKLRQSMHAYLGAISKRLDCAPIVVGGVEDHVHLLARFGRTVTQAEWVKELKRVSNEWIQKEGIADFQWQAGYAGFSISQSNLEQVSAYIMRQEEHHKKTSFQDELRALLRKHQMEWDEKYLWD